uniref:inner centromere protein A-like n=1 Tax=Myxine glutinosa TaxID=7769 RepID=UPI00358F5B95
MMLQLDGGVFDLLDATQGKVIDMLWNTLHKESTNFVHNVESNHFAWLDEIVLTAMRGFSSEMPQLLPITPSVKNRYKQKRAMLTKESRRSSRVVRKSLARHPLFQLQSQSPFNDFRRVTRACAMKNTHAPLAPVSTENDVMDVADNDWMDVCVEENVNERLKEKGRHLPISKFNRLKISTQLSPNAHRKTQSKAVRQIENEVPASANSGKADAIASNQEETGQNKMLTRHCYEAQGSSQKKIGHSNSARSACKATEKMPLKNSAIFLRSSSATTIRKMAVGAPGRQKQMNDAENCQSCSEEEFGSNRTRTQRERTPIDGHGPQHSKAFPPQKTTTNLLDSSKANLKTPHKNLASPLQRTPSSVSAMASRAAVPRRLNKDNRKVLMEQLLKKQQMDEERKNKAEEEKRKKLDEMRKKREERLRKAREKALLNEQEKKRKLEERAQERKQVKTQGYLRTPTPAARDTRVGNARPDTDDDDVALIPEREKEPRTVANLREKVSKNLESYEMTPCPATPKPVTFCDEDDYGLDIVSGDSTDDEDCPRKPVPKWATGKALRLAITKQYTHPIDFDALFEGMLVDLKLEVIFAKFKPCFEKRTSSAIWNSPPSQPDLSNI